MTTIIVATAEGLRIAGQQRDPLNGQDVTAVALGREGLWALVAHRDIYRVARGQAERIATLDDAPPAWSLVDFAGTLFIGTENSGLFKLEAREVSRVSGFDAAPGRSEWWQPPGRPATTWTLASGGGQLYVNVHVGGILRSRDAGATFTQTIDVDVDVHEVQLGGDGRLWAATGKSGLAESRDTGTNWTFHTKGLHATYLTCVAPTEDGVLVAASSGFASDDDAVYRFDGKKFVRCDYGLPNAFKTHLSARQLSAHGRHAAVAGGDGNVYATDDCGRSWRVALDDVPDVRGIVLA